MRTWITSYADAAYVASRDRLVASARRHGIDELRPWSRGDVERTSLYAMHQPILDRPRGGGYWLWKPFILKETMKEMGQDDLLIYSDAGIEIIRDLSPLIEHCRARAEIMLFAGHYDDVGAPGPNLCGKWTKRDAFVVMDCDERRYHQGQMLDASFIVLRKTARSVAFLREWLLYCCQPQLLTDDPSVCGLPELPDFIEHRHDQSLLSLLAIREGLDVFRHPSQFGNHLKDEPYREEGEWIRAAYGAHGIYRNSPYHTLLRHHRGDLGPTSLTLSLRRVVRAPREQVFERWMDPQVLEQWRPLGSRVSSATADVSVGGAYELALAGSAIPSLHLSGTFLDVRRPARLVYGWRWNTTVTVDFGDDDDGTVVMLTHDALPSEKLREFHHTAWNAWFDALDGVLTIKT